MEKRKKDEGKKKRKKQEKPRTFMSGTGFHIKDARLIKYQFQ